MRVNLDCNKPKPQFGMLQIPKTTHPTYKNFAEILRLQDPVVQRGLREFTAEQAANFRYNVRYTDNEVIGFPRFEVVEQTTKKVIEAFSAIKGITGLEHFGTTKFPFRKKLARIFNPKQELPYGMLLAGEKANKLEIAAIQEELLAERINNITK